MLRARDRPSLHPVARLSGSRTEPLGGPRKAEAKALALVVEDESPTRALLRVALVSHGYRVLEAATGEQALQVVVAEAPDVILLDLGLGDIDGVALVKRLREVTATPVIVVSARRQEQAKVDVLDAGADDYVDKPFGIDELMARIRAAARHAPRPAERVPCATIQVGDLRMDLTKRRVFAGPEEVHLTPTEYKLLALLMQHAGRALTHGELLRVVWGPGHDHNAQYLRVYMVQLRRKLERDPARPRYLVTETGVGYRIKVPAPSKPDSKTCATPEGQAVPTARSR